MCVQAGQPAGETEDRAPAGRAVAETLDELERDLARLRRRGALPPSAGGRIRLAVAEAALLGGLHGVPGATEQESDIRPRRLCGKPCRNGFRTADQSD